ncbi:hypothetical protein CARUB_v10018168mg, partial [Capsella rubella]
NILASFDSFKLLALKIPPSEITFPTGSIFNQLVCLELCTYRVGWCNLLTAMLDSSPNLRVLKLIGQKQDFEDFVWTQPKNVPECLLLHLETFVWRFYKGRLEDEKEVAKYILRNASCLKKAVFSKLSIIPEERVEIVKELERVVRASNTSNLNIIIN